MAGFFGAGLTSSCIISPSENRAKDFDVPTHIKNELEFLEKTGYEPDAIQTLRGSVDAFEFFEMHPELLDPDLRQLINLEFLLKDAYEAQLMGEKAFSKAGKRGREMEKQSKSFSRNAVVSAPLSPNLGPRSRYYSPLAQRRCPFSSSGEWADPLPA
jgi:hypothetical protein